MKVHEEDTCGFKLKAVQESQRKTEQKAKQKTMETSGEVFVVQQAEMSEFSDASDNLIFCRKCKKS
jgi:hypothetical protein